jgi:hypothetical protein
VSRNGRLACSRSGTARRSPSSATCPAGSAGASSPSSRRPARTTCWCFSGRTGAFRWGTCPHSGWRKEKTTLIIFRFLPHPVTYPEPLSEPLPVRIRCYLSRDLSRNGRLPLFPGVGPRGGPPPPAWRQRRLPVPHVPRVRVGGRPLPPGRCGPRPLPPPAPRGRGRGEEDLHRRVGPGGGV